MLYYTCTLLATNRKVNLTMDELGTRIKCLRKKSGYSLRQFGKICNLSHSYISDIEKGRTNPSLQTLQTIANKLNTNMSYLLGESTNKCTITKTDNNKYCYNTKDYEIIQILNNNPKLKQSIYDLKNTSSQQIDIFLKTWAFIKSIYENINR